MKHTPYKYKFYCNSITIVSRFESGYNIFDTLKEAKEYGCQHPYAINEAEHAAYRERLRLTPKEELFDELFEYIESEETANKDNANLIAAAPEMLGALKGALKYLKNQLYMDGHTTELLDTYEIIKSAIVKAEGK